MTQYTCKMNLVVINLEDINTQPVFVYLRQITSTDPNVFIH